MSNRLGGIIGCKDKTTYGIQTDSSMMVVISGKQYNVGEKPTVSTLTLCRDTRQTIVYKKNV